MLAQRKDETPLQYWISLWPAAPLFGVPWRFEAMMPGAAFFRPSAVAAEMTARVAEETARATEESVSHAAAEVEAVATTLEAEADAVAAAPEADAPESEADEAPMNGAAEPTVLYAAPPAQIDDLKLIKGVGPKLEALLNELGVYRFEQIAHFSEAELAWLDEHLSTFKGRPFRDDWPAQAKALM